MSETDNTTPVATTEENKPVEGEETKPTEETNPSEEAADKTKRKNSRAEKKLKEVLLKHNLTQLQNVSTVMMRKGQQLMWTFSQPEVYFIENVYIIFGEPSMDDPARRVIDALPKFAENETEEKDATNTKVVDDEEGDATGLKEEDINTIMQQSNVTRARAITALREANGDLVTAVMNLAL